MLGDIFIDILTNYFESGMSTDLEEVCKKKPSFAGFWFEKSFFHITSDIKQIFVLTPRIKIVKSLPSHSIVSL